MALIKWNGKEALEPFRELENLQKEMNRLFEHTLWPAREFIPLEKGEWLPAMDVREEKDRILVRADLPGMKQEEIRVEVEDGALVIRGERKREAETKEGRNCRIERSYGAFLRSFTLPSSVDETKVSAVYKNGVLEVTLPKREGAKPKQISIKVEKEG
ncbi:MAG: Hsp20/alpha crystallin family protein [Candidatus Omnitrophica bacterium]|nr:Hsp20/alpha crystallin family protein [Candidatus Omnitrophota bacterium]